MKIGESVYANKHVEFLNELLGTDYKAWMKSSRKLSDGKLLWMIELGNFVTKAGFINKLVGQDKISEKHSEKDFAYEGHNTYKRALSNGQSWDYSERVVFDVVKLGSSRKYVFRGVFRLNKEESTVEENIWNLVADEYKF